MKPMEPAVHQTLINDIENLLASPAGIDETIAKQYRKQAEQLIQTKPDHTLTKDVKTCLTHLRERIHLQVEKRDADFEKVIAELTRANSALKEENLKTVEDATHKALSIAGQIPGLSDQRRGEIDAQLEQIYPKMRKLTAWRHWGTTRAREELIEQIKQIVDSGMDPNKIVSSLRAAKKQWQDWEKTGDHSEHKLWKEFSDTCDAAYAPCRVYFKEQQQLRKDNLKLKRELIAEMQQRFEETDWKQPDWKDVDKWLRQARSRFFKIGHTDYKHHKKLKAALDEIQARFDEHLSRERERSLKARQKLIADVVALEEVDPRSAIAELDTLKKRWVITVLSRRNIENKLWKDFQKAQDQVYAKRNADRKEQDKERNDNLKQKRLLVEKLLKAANGPGEALLNAPSLAAQLEDQFKAIGYVPRKAEKALMESWRNAHKAHSAALSKAQEAQRSNARNALRDKALFCAELEQQQLKGQQIDAEQAQQAFDSLPALSDKLDAQLRERLSQVIEDQLDNESLKQNTEAQLQRCLKLEVMLDLDTPAEYAKARMAFQIERLSASMSKNTRAQEDAATLREQLLTCGAVEADQYEALRMRIDPILSAALN